MCRGETVAVEEETVAAEAAATDGALMTVGGKVFFARRPSLLGQSGDDGGEATSFSVAW